MADATYIYCRISDDPTGQQAGVERQERECRQLAERRGWAVAEVLVDNDLSATSGVRRPAFERLLESSPGRIITWHLDRLLRLSGDLERVLGVGCNVFTVESGELDLSNPAGRAVARTITAWAQYEGEQKAVRQKSKHRQRREQGGRWWMRKPFGYTLDGDVVEVEAEAIRQACQAILDGASLRSIARDWEARGFRSDVGNVMHPSVVRGVLSSPRNIARVTYKGVEVGDGEWEPILDDATFRSVARRLSRPARRTATDSRRRGLLTGLLRCGVCDTGMGLTSQRRNGRDYHHYACMAPSRCVSWPRDWLEEHMSELALTIYRRVEWDPAWAEVPQDRSAEAEAEVARLEQLLDELMEDRLSGALSRDQWVRASESAQGRLEAARRALGSAGGAVAHDRAMLDAAGKARRWIELPVDDKRTLIGNLFPSVTLGRSGRTRWRPEPDVDAIDYGLETAKAP